MSAWAEPYEVWAFDCPECGGQTMLGDAEPDGIEVCVDCGAAVQMGGAEA